jgi:hypothetical protein
MKLTETTLPCPTWCEMAEGHGFHFVDHETGTLIRDHVRSFGSHVSLCQEEAAITEDGPVWTMSPPYLDVTDDLTGLGVAEAVSFAADFADATALLRSLVGRQVH